MQDDEFSKVLDQLRAAAPQLKVHAESYHTTTTGSGEHRRTSEHIDAVEEELFKYSAWRDASGKVAGLEKYKIVAIEVVAVTECHDMATTQCLADLHNRLKGACYRRAPHNTRSHEEVSLAHAKFPLKNSRVFVTRSPGVKSAGWMTPSTYRKCRFALPFLGTIYRIVFLTSMANVKFRLSKEISWSEQSGAGWLKFTPVDKLMAGWLKA
jgi:hypothetical protein